MEFGDPIVEFRGPRLLPAAIAGVPDKVLRRLVRVAGQWQLWIYCCDWTLHLDDAVVAHDQSSHVSMDRALQILNGQQLTAVTMEPDSRIRFSFDLGCTLFIRPSQPGTFAEQEPASTWMLYQPGSRIAILRDDGSYTTSPSNQPDSARAWHQLTQPITARSPDLHADPDAEHFPAQNELSGAELETLKPLTDGHQNEPDAVRLGCQ